jgi:hypothetical protein
MWAKVSRRNFVNMSGERELPTNPEAPFGPPLTLPPAALTMREGESFTEVFCRSRKKYVKLEPEEWVRQHWLAYLTDALGYPPGLVAVECPLKLNGMKRRADIVCHDRSGRPLLMVECKAPNVALDEKVYQQAARYNMVLQVPVLVISNGVQHHALQFFPDRMPQFLMSIPSFSELDSASL